MTRLLLPLLLLLAFHTSAQPFSFVYIQGDKETPIYVKLEGAMQSRYGPNYCIIPRLAPGVIHLQVLFQQNKFPPQDFTVRVPEGGQRSFLVTHRDDAFALYDLRQGFYLPAGNDVAQDRLPESGRQPATVATATPQQQPAETVPATPPPPAGPTFIQDLELGHDGTGTPAVKKKTKTKPAATVPVAAPTATTPANPDACPTMMDVVTFGAFYRQVLGQTGLDARLTFLMDSDACPTPDQARIIARSLDGDEAKLRYLSRVIRRSNTPRSFAPLEVLLLSADAKARFRQALQPR